MTSRRMLLDQQHSFKMKTLNTRSSKRQTNHLVRRFTSNNHVVESEFDDQASREFLKCEYNRDGDSYRSPWSNRYFPQASDDAIYPSNDLLALEQKANDVFQRYVGLYFDQGAMSSVYFFDTEFGFGGCFLVKKGIL